MKHRAYIKGGLIGVVQDYDRDRGIQVVDPHERNGKIIRGYIRNDPKKGPQSTFQVRLDKVRDTSKAFIALHLRHERNMLVRKKRKAKLARKVERAAYEARSAATVKKVQARMASKRAAEAVAVPPQAVAAAIAAALPKKRKRLSGAQRRKKNAASA